MAWTKRSQSLSLAEPSSAEVGEHLVNDFECAKVGEDPLLADRFCIRVGEMLRRGYFSD